MSVVCERWLNRHGWLAALASVLALSCAAVAQEGPPAARVRLDAVRMERLERQRQVTGGLRAVHRARVAAEHEGLVRSLEADVGDVVQEGQVLAQLDGTLLSLDLERYRAERDSAAAKAQEFEARVAKAERDVERLKSATGKGGVSTMELEDSRLDLKAEEALAGEAQADLASAEVRVRYAEEEIAKMTIHAPFSGAIVRKRVEVGEWVEKGGDVFEMLDTSAVDAWLDVPQDYVDAVASTSAGVRVVVDALDLAVDSTDVVVVAEGDALARTFPVRVRLRNEGGALRPGMSVIGLVPTGEPTSAKTVHKDAILRDDAGTYVYADMGGKATPIRVRKLWAVGDRVVVEADGLAPGMGLVVEGNERLFPMQRIRDVSGEDARGGGSDEASGAERGKG